MDLLIKFKGYFLRTFDQGSLGFSLSEVIAIIAFLILAVVIRGLFAKIILSKIKKLIKKTGNKVDDQLFEALSSPLKTLPIILVFIVMGLLVNVESQLFVFLEKINQTLVTVFVFWLLHQSLVPLSQAFQKLEELLSKALVLWLTRSIKYLIIFLGIVAVLETWGIKIGPVIAGLGLFGVAVALGAQDLFKNLISGILVLVERRFQVGDWIFVEGVIEGTVESIGFRSTVVRRFDKSLATIPNFQFAENAVINNSQTTNRRINWMIGLEYKTTSEQLKNIKDQIENYIKNSKDFSKSADTMLSVKIDQFAASSIDIRLICFTETTNFKEWLNVKDFLAIEIKDIVEKNKASFAFPSTSIYVEKNQ